jgi:hypothetical protein
MNLYNVVVNGASSSLNANNGTAATGSLSATAETALTVGARGNGVNPGNIETCEIILYGAALSASQITQVNNYLNQKYAVY